MKLMMKKECEDSADSSADSAADSVAGLIKTLHDACTLTSDYLFYDIIVCT